MADKLSIEEISNLLGNIIESIGNVAKLEQLEGVLDGAVKAAREKRIGADIGNLATALMDEESSPL